MGERHRPRPARAAGRDLPLRARPEAGDASRAADRLPTALDGRRVLIVAPRRRRAAGPGAKPRRRRRERPHRRHRPTRPPRSPAPRRRPALPYHAVLVDQRIPPDAGRALERIRRAAGARLPGGGPDRAGTARRDRGAARERLRRLSRPAGPAFLASAHRRRDHRGDRRLPRRPERCTAGAARHRGGGRSGASRSSSPRTTRSTPCSSAPSSKASATRSPRCATAGRRGRGDRRRCAFRRGAHGPAHAAPRRSGSGAADSRARVRRQAACRRAAIVALTADVLAETRAEAAAAGIDAVLAKPIAPEFAAPRPCRSRRLKRACHRTVRKL